jgi:hypothetical protein
MATRVTLKLLSHRSQTNISPRYLSQRSGVPVMALGSENRCDTPPRFRTFPNAVAAGQLMLQSTNSRIIVTTAETSSEPTQPSLFEKKTNTELSVAWSIP